MSTVTLSKPHCAITSAEKPEGIASQAFTTTFPDAQISLTLFAIVPSLRFKSSQTCRPAARPFSKPLSPLVAPNAALGSQDRALLGCPLDACLADTNLAGGVDD